MFSKSATTMLRAITQLFRNWPALAIMIVTYGLILAGGYLFVTTKEATRTQVLITIGLAFLTPAMFFVLQTVAASYATGPRAGSLFVRSIKNSWKLIIVSLPVIVIAAFGFYLLARTQTHFSSTSPSLHWVGLVMSTLRYLLIGVFAPLALIHLWVAAEHNGLLATVKRLLSHLASAFAPRSVFIYVVGLIFFAFVPYLVLFKTVTVDRAWLEIGLFVTRLTVVFCLTLFGWAVTVGTLALIEQLEQTPNPIEGK